MTITAQWLIFGSICAALFVWGALAGRFQNKSNEQIVKKISQDLQVIVTIKESIADSDHGRVISWDEATQKLKERAS